jgi:hypothetical protein
LEKNFHEFFPKKIEVLVSFGKHFPRVSASNSAWKVGCLSSVSRLSLVCLSCVSRVSRAEACVCRWSSYAGLPWWPRGRRYRDLPMDPQRGAQGRKNIFAHIVPVGPPTPIVGIKSTFRPLNRCPLRNFTTSFAPKIALFRHSMRFNIYGGILIRPKRTESSSPILCPVGVPPAPLYQCWRGAHAGGHLGHSKQH